MSQGKGNASRATMIIFVVVLLCLLVYSAPVRAATYTVGDKSGWTFGVVNWPEGKTFKAGDKLVFNYWKLFHNVVEVDTDGYKNCKAPEGAKVHKTGNDTITLVKGSNSFICSVIGHCFLGMKITVNAD